MLTIGITGPTGAGKTTVLEQLKKLGAAVIDCDALYHNILESDVVLQDTLVKKFGNIRDVNGAVDRKRLGDIVFHAPDKLTELNQIVHKTIAVAVKQRLAAFVCDDVHSIAAIDASGLFESGLYKLCDITLAVLASKEIRAKRIMAREGIGENYALARISAQQPDSFYLSHSMYVLRNETDNKEEFEAAVRKFLNEIIPK